MHSFILPLTFILGIFPANSQWVGVTLVCHFGTVPVKLTEHKLVLAEHLIVRRSVVIFSDTYWHLNPFNCSTGKKKKITSLVMVTPKKEYQSGILCFGDDFFSSCQKQLMLPESLMEVLNQIKTPFCWQSTWAMGIRPPCVGPTVQVENSKDLLNTYCIKCRKSAQL